MLSENLKPEITVFVSYSHDSEEHISRAKSLADSLCSYGIKAIFDGYEMAPEEGWPKWMLKSLDRSNFALIICSRGYHDKFNGKVLNGKGVKFESLIGLQELFENQSENAKYIPVFFEADDEKYIPTPLRGFQYYCLESNEGFEELYRHLTGQPKHARPELGKVVNMDSELQENDSKFSLQDTSNLVEASLSQELNSQSKIFATIEMHLDRNFEEFNAKQQEQFLKSISALLNIDNTEIRIKKIEKGSVKITLEIPLDSLNELLELRKHKLALYEKVVENEKIERVFLDTNSDGIDAIEPQAVTKEEFPKNKDTVTGTVKWFNNAKGFGFITPEDGGEDIFAHFSTIQMEGYRSLTAGQEVTYVVQQGPKGLHAENIEYVSKKH